MSPRPAWLVIDLVAGGLAFRLGRPVASPVSP
jgi:hypothetical protein